MISVVIPAFNEEQNIPRITTELVPVLERLDTLYEIVVIDDGSDDNTIKKVIELKKKIKEIKLVKHGNNRGLGCAVRTGIASSIGEIIIILDADFTFHPSEIPKLYEYYKKNGCDCVIGSHFGKGGRTEDVAFHRLFLSKCINLFYSILMRKKVSSVSSIFRLYRADMLKDITLASKGFDINAEILYKLIQKKANIAEVPVTLTSRKFGKSKLRMTREIKNNIRMLFRILTWKMGL